MTEAVSIVTIKNKIPLFKKEEQANSIELIELEEVGNTLVSQKGLYEIGDKAVFIQPDYSLPDTTLFESFYRPGGDPKKCLLGSNGRIKAKKFNLHIGDDLPVYSYGILLPHNEVRNYLNSQGIKTSEIDGICSFNNLTELLGITKWEEPDETHKFGIKGGSSSNFPEGVIRTDETNFNNLTRHIEKLLPCRLIAREKIDGSSITLWYKNGKSGIASRNLGKPLTIKRITGRRSKTILERLLFWSKPDLNIYSEQPNDSDFVRIGKPYLDILIDYCNLHDCNYVLQGEIYGQNMKGSGNKNNPHAKLETDIAFFNLCEYQNQSIKLDETRFNNFRIKNNIKVPTLVGDKEFNSLQEIIDFSNNYFKNNLVEGLVFRTFDHNFSFKFMNLEYDSKK